MDTTDPSNIHYKGVHAAYYIKGLKVGKGLESMKVTLITAVPHPRKPMKARGKVELYEDVAVEKYCARASRKVGVSAELLEVDLNLLVEELEKYRERAGSVASSSNRTQSTSLGSLAAKKAELFLQGPDLFSRLNSLIGESGIVGEERTRLLLLLVASSYKNDNTLHALIQGSSGTGKTLLMRKIMEMIPGADRHVWTQVSDKSLYYAGDELKHSAIGIEDWDGLSEGAQYVLRELQSGSRLSQTVTDKHEDGGFYRKELVAEGPISSLMCTTHGEIYEDNMNRCLLVAVDESIEQTDKILEYQYRKDRGELDKHTEEMKTKELENLVSLLRPLKVVNPYAGKLRLPKGVHKIRRLNNLFQSFVKQVTWWHQYQRERDKLGRLVTTKEDLALAIDLLFETIVLKVDELDGSLRQFYERLKTYVEQEDRSYEFNRLEVRHALKISKTQQHRFMGQLLSLEYIERTRGHGNKGYYYKIVYWDDK